MPQPSRPGLRVAGDADRRPSRRPRRAAGPRRGQHWNRYVDLSLLAVAIVWGSSYLAAKDAVSAAAPLLVLFARYAITAVTCFAAEGLRPGRRSGRELRSRTERAGRGWLRTGVILGVTQWVVLVFETYGVAHTSAANAGVLISLTIVIAPVLERSPALSGPFFAALTVSVVGVVLLVSGAGFDRPGIGDALVLLAALARAAHVVLLGRMTRRTAMGGELRALPLTAAQSVVGAVLCGLLAAPHFGDLAGLSVGTWVALSYLAIACSVFAFAVQTWAVRRTSASRACLMLGTEPVWALLVAVAIGGERLAAISAVGAVLVVAGTWRAQAVETRLRRRAHERPQTLESTLSGTGALPPDPAPVPSARMTETATLAGSDA